jgi:hypothetical protein
MRPAYRVLKRCPFLSQSWGSVAVDELYKVTLAFKAIEDYVLPTPIDISTELHVERQGDG